MLKALEPVADFEPVEGDDHEVGQAAIYVIVAGRVLYLASGPELYALAL
ncbi:hypothetical protein ABZ614_07660 [Streptomyces sp. NPDC013178]